MWYQNNEMTFLLKKSFLRLLTLDQNEQEDQK